MILQTLQIMCQTARHHILEYHDLGHKFVRRSVPSWISHSHNTPLSQIQMRSYTVCSRHLQLVSLHQGDTVRFATQNRLLNVLYSTYPSLSVNNFNLLKPSGFFPYHKVQYSKILHGAHFVLSVLHGYQNRQ